VLSLNERWRINAAHFRRPRSPPEKATLFCSFNNAPVTISSFFAASNYWSHNESSGDFKKRTVAPNEMKLKFQPPSHVPISTRPIFQTNFIQRQYFGIEHSESPKQI